jgi:hypothetical protein
MKKGYDVAVDDNDDDVVGTSVSQDRVTAVSPSSTPVKEIGSANGGNRPLKTLCKDETRRVLSLYVCL